MDFSRTLIEWQRVYGRHSLPWQGTRDPYRIWVSEIMLQQTQVAAVVPYYQRFIESFPDVLSLAAASEEQVLTHWAGLGYYVRGRNLHRAARQIVQQYAGRFPASFEDIQTLSGIGRTTAAAISVFAYGQRRAILDGNVKRVLTRVFGISGWPGEKSLENRLWQLADSLLPKTAIETYTQGLMDLGATVCTRGKPRCGECPLSADCVALRQNLVDQIPTARPKKAMPQRAVTLLLLRHGRDILLEKRPAPGIWGGLWSLPELQTGAELACLQLTGAPPTKQRPLPALKHSFTHFHLHIQPLEIVLSSLPPAVSQPDKIWMDVQTAVSAAIPKPVKTILQSLC